jgi:hypothetical protein
VIDCILGRVCVDLRLSGAATARSENYLDYSAAAVRRFLRVIPCLALASASAFGQNSAPSRKPVAVTVCVDRPGPSLDVLQAEQISAGMFAAAEVDLNWQAWNKHCPEDAVRVTFTEGMKAPRDIDTLAYALPYEGFHIFVLWDRLRMTASPRVLPQLLAHVLVHEITHILQGIKRHSDSGIMKAVYSAEDISEMHCHPLPFTAEDLQLIELGIKGRQARVRAGALRPVKVSALPATLSFAGQLRH